MTSSKKRYIRWERQYIEWNNGHIRFLKQLPYPEAKEVIRLLKLDNARSIREIQNIVKGGLWKNG